MKIGDKVRFLSETGGGRISGFRSGNIVLVEDEDGFEIPTQKSEIVVVESDKYNFSTNLHIEGKTIPKSESASIKNLLNSNLNEDTVEIDPSENFVVKPKERIGGEQLSVYLAFVPTNINDFTKTNFNVYIVNDSNYYIYYIYSLKDGGECLLHSSNEIEPNMKLLIENINREKLNALANINIQFLAYKNDVTFSLKNPVSINCRINPIKFYKKNSFQENLYFNEPSFIYPLIEKDKIPEPIFIDAKHLEDKLASSSSNISPARLKENNGNNQRSCINSSQKLKNDKIIIDLHASEILETTMGMTSSDILSYQVDYFKKVLEQYKKQKGRKIVFIHGKGDGILRQAIIHELNYRYKHYSYQDASFQEYGFGATQVTIK